MRVYLLLLISSFCVCEFGCAPPGTKGPADKPPQPAKDNASPTPARTMTYEQIVIAESALNHKAAALLERITDEKSAFALVAEIRAMIEEKQAHYALAKAQKFTDEERKALNPELLEAFKKSQKHIIAAATPFENSRSLVHITRALEKAEGIDITRWKYLKKKPQ